MSFLRFGEKMSLEEDLKKSIGEEIDKSEGLKKPVNVYDKKFNMSSWIRKHIVLIGIVLGVLIIAVAIIISLFSLRTSNPLASFQNATSKAIDSSGFNFKMNVKVNDKDYLNVDGAMNFNTRESIYNSRYTAAYNTYKYDGLVCSFGKSGYRGVNLKKEWAVEDCRAKIVDFFDFYQDFRRHRFDANAFISLFDLNGVYNSKDLQKAVDTFIKDTNYLTVNSMGGYSYESEEGTVYEFKPRVATIMELVKDSIPSIYSNSEGYEKFLAKYELNKDNFSNEVIHFSYVIDKEGYLKRFLLEINNGKSLSSFEFLLSDYGKAEVVIPDEFYEAAGISASK